MTLRSDPLPTFRTPRLVLRPRRMADLDACLAMDRDKQVTHFVDGPWSDPIAHRAFVEDRLRRIYPPGMGYWAILAPSFIGWILLTPLNLQGLEIEIGWRLVRAAWGHGYATEAARPVLDHAIHGLSLPRVVADIDPRNVASIRVALKLGLTPEGKVEHAGRRLTRYAALAPWARA